MSWESEEHWILALPLPSFLIVCSVPLSKLQLSFMKMCTDVGWNLKFKQRSLLTNNYYFPHPMSHMASIGNLLLKTKTVRKAERRKHQHSLLPCLPLNRTTSLPTLPFWSTSCVLEIHKCLLFNRMGYAEIMPVFSKVWILNQIPQKHWGCLAHTFSLRQTYWF